MPADIQVEPPGRPTFWGQFLLDVKQGHTGENLVLPGRRRQRERPSPHQNLHADRPNQPRLPPHVDIDARPERPKIVSPDSGRVSRDGGDEGG